MITPVKYPLAKLLNDKEFKLEPYLKIDDQNPKNLNSNYNPREYQPWYLDLSLAEVVMWLYEKHNIWIVVNMSRYGNFYTNILKKESTKSLDIPFVWEMQCQLNDFKSPTEAYEAAIEYVLLNLI